MELLLSEISSSHMPHVGVEDRSGTLVQGSAESHHTECRNNTQDDGNGLAKPNSTGDGRPSEDHGRQQAQLKAVWLAAVDTVATKSV